MKLVLDLQGAQTESRLRGIGRQTLSLTKAILARGGDHDISVLLNSRLTTNLDALVAELSHALPADRIVFFGVPGPVAERDPANLWRMHAAELLRETALARLQPDVVHLGSLFEGYVDDAVVSIGRLNTEHATAVTLHDLIPLMDPRYLAEPGPRNHWLRRAQFLKRADLLLSVSEASKREASSRLQIPAHRIDVISAGVSPAFLDVDIGAARPALLARYDLNAPFLLYVGAVDARKNVSVIFDAFTKLPKTVRDGHLIAFVGRLFDEEIGELTRDAARLGVPADRLRFCHHVPDDDLIALYQASAAFVFPSTLEGFGLPPLEAMACGAAVLASKTSSLPEVVGDPAYLFDPHDAAELAHKLEPLLLDPDQRQAAREFGRTRARQFTWERSADLALRSIEALHARRQGRERARARSALSPSAPRIARKPRLAFLSPLPPARSGIADYSAELLRELGRFYDIDCIGTGEACDDPWILANFPVRDVAFFVRNAARYERILYSIGNSHLHAHMLALIERFPGVVILHDFFLSDLLDWMGGTKLAAGDVFVRELYRSHGVAALVADRRYGRRASVDRYPCNGLIFRAAQGVIVHSRWAVDAARALFGEETADRMRVIPHLRALPPQRPDRHAARHRLGLAGDDVVTCSFGIMTRRKCSREVFEAWCASAGPKGQLVFVGGAQDDEYGAALKVAIDASPFADRVVVTGYASPALYRDYLAAADLAIQVRTTSRGESSGTILDCLAHGVPTIVNAHGPAAEFADTVVSKLPDAFTVESLSAAIDALLRDPDERSALGERGRDFIRASRDPDAIGATFFGAIESFATSRAVVEEQALLGAITDGTLAGTRPGGEDFRAVARLLAVQRPRIGARQILYDVTVLSERDQKTGIQRVVRAMLQQLVDCPPQGYTIEAVRMDGPVLRYARAFMGGLLDIASGAVPDEVCDGGPEDIYLSIDWVPDRLPLVEPWLADFRRTGGRVIFAVHDLLPLQFPKFFPAYMPGVTERWFESCLRVADQFVCVSRTIADDVLGFGTAMAGDSQRAIAVDYFHNAADLDASVPTRGLPDDADAMIATIAMRRTFLLVGTIEPRKGHAQVLRGFEQLWRDGIDVGLVIVGKSGWMMDDFVEALQRHPEHGGRLLWLHDISDEFLVRVYAASSALVAASEGEGFGLPLVEAALHGTALIARDIPVFREVAGVHAFYFAGSAPDDVRQAIAAWLELAERGEAPSPEGFPVLTWRQATDRLMSIILGRQHYGLIPSAVPRGLPDPAREATGQAGRPGTGTT